MAVNFIIEPVITPPIKCAGCGEEVPGYLQRVIANLWGDAGKDKCEDCNFVNAVTSLGANCVR